MLTYLWENLGSCIYSLSNFECVMRQLLFQKWIPGINYIMQSSVTKQMVL